MTDKQKIQIESLRNEGKGYKKIAQALGMSENTVKSYCKRNNLVVPVKEEGKGVCKCCGVTVTQNEGRKKKIFCSDRCRMKWWNSHLDQVKRKANYSFVCPTCHKEFSAYGNSSRKYCCHACYIEDRFGGVI